MKTKTVLFALTIMLLIGCDSELEKPTSILSDDVLKLTAEVTSLRFAGLDTTNLIARIPKDAGKLDVKFSATHGRFISSNDKTVNQYADSVSGDYRYAIAALTSDSAVTKVFITAEVTSARQRIEISFIK